MTFLPSYRGSTSRKVVQCDSKWNRIFSYLDKQNCNDTCCSKQFNCIQVAIDIVAKDCYPTSKVKLDYCSNFKMEVLKLGIFICLHYVIFSYPYLYI